MINWDEISVRAMIGGGLGLIALFLMFNFFAKFEKKPRISRR